MQQGQRQGEPLLFASLTDFLGHGPQTQQPTAQYHSNNASLRPAGLQQQQFQQEPLCDSSMQGYEQGQPLPHRAGSLHSIHEDIPASTPMAAAELGLQRRSSQGSMHSVVSRLNGPSMGQNTSGKRKLCSTGTAGQRIGEAGLPPAHFMQLPTAVPPHMLVSQPLTLDPAASSEVLGAGGPHLSFSRPPSHSLNQLYADYQQPRRPESRASLNSILRGSHPAVSRENSLQLGPDGHLEVLSPELEAHFSGLTTLDLPATLPYGTARQPSLGRTGSTSVQATSQHLAPPLPLQMPNLAVSSPAMSLSATTRISGGGDQPRMPSGLLGAQWSSQGGTHLGSSCALRSSSSRPSSQQQPQPPPHAMGAAPPGSAMFYFDLDSRVKYDSADVLDGLHLLDDVMFPDLQSLLNGQSGTSEQRLTVAQKQQLQMHQPFGPAAKYSRTGSRGRSTRSSPLPALHEPTPGLQAPHAKASQGVMQRFPLGSALLPMPEHSTVGGPGYEARAAQHQLQQDRGGGGVQQHQMFQQFVEEQFDAADALMMDILSGDEPTVNTLGLRTGVPGMDAALDVDVLGVPGHSRMRPLPQAGGGLHGVCAGACAPAQATGERRDGPSSVGVASGAAAAVTPAMASQRSGNMRQRSGSIGSGLALAQSASGTYSGGPESSLGGATQTCESGEGACNGTELQSSSSLDAVHRSGQLRSRKLEPRREPRRKATPEAPRPPSHSSGLSVANLSSAEAATLQQQQQQAAPTKAPAPPAGASSRPQSAAGDGATTKARTYNRTIPSFADIVSHNLFQSGRFRWTVGNIKDEIEVEVTPSGDIVYEGVAYPSISAFALVVLRSRNADRQACDGWKEVRHGGQKMEVLRKECLRLMYELGEL